ncbi:MAG TPA: DNA-binding response regulator, partial [Adhaeribacter sp.]|nr:DNA-binding response regulator [Adhaeribacter sp.]
MDGHTLIIEDERLVAENVAAILQQAGYCQTFITDQLAEARHFFLNNPVKLIISDIHLHNSQVSGPDIVRDLQARRPVPVIYLTAFSEELIVEDALKTEPAAYVLKPFTDRQLLVAVRLAVKTLADEPTAAVCPKPSVRELEIVQYLSEGLSSKKIGERLFISEHTVSTHRRNLLKRYALESSS